jgi:hypothetical protein
MEKLSDFKPFERVVLPKLGALDCSGLILIVGPNSSGKTQLLRDLHHRVKGDIRDLVVAREIKIRKADYEPFMSCLKNEGYLTEFADPAGTKQLLPKATYVGTGEAAQPIAVNQAQLWHSAYPDDNPGATTRRNDWLSYFGRFVVTALFLERRLVAANEVGIIDFVTQPPQQDLHALYLNDAAKSELLTEIQKTFGKAVWPDASRGPILAIKVSGRPDVPTEADRLSPTKMAGYRTIESEGDGLKSYVATCIAILLGRRPLCLVDEPEMCLHPPQAYNLGRFIGRFGSSSDTATFVATHSSHVLRGAIETARKLQIVRLVRRDEAFEAHLVQSETLAEALKKPAVRAESVLDGIFSQAVVVLEADTDRTVYQATWEILQTETNLDIHFSAVGGSGGIADTCHLYRTLKIPVAVIADLDVLVDRERLKQILASLVQEDEVKPLLDRATEIGNRLRSIPPTLSPDDLRARLNSVLTMSMDWSHEDDGPIRRQLSEITQDIDRMKRLKRGGVSALPSQMQKEVGTFVEDLARHGLFLVPVGELEQWLGQSEVAASKNSKWAWAIQAAEYIRTVQPRDDGLWEFIRGVARFLRQ